MISFKRTLFQFFANILDFYSRDYILEENKFIRVRKMNFYDHINYILVQKGCTSYIEALRFMRLSTNGKFKSITSQAIGKQRVYISPNLFKDMFESFLDMIYPKSQGMFKINGFMVAACDGSIFDLPNFTITREEFPPGGENLLKYKRTGARVSCFLDVSSKMILNIKIVERSISEITLAKQQLMELKNHFDITKLITIYDRGYNSIELMIKTEDLGSKFLIRLRSNTFKNQVKKMKTNDEIISFNLTKNFLNRFEDEKLREKAEKMGRFSLRIVKVELKNGTIETLATNLTKEEFSSKELKELYAKRWTVETGFDRLKNLIEIEEFSGNRRIIIEQDFYAHIFIYNLAIILKFESEEKITRKPREKGVKIEYFCNFSRLLGNIYSYFYDILTSSNREKEMIFEFLVEQGSKELTQVNLSKNCQKERKTAYSDNDHPGNKKRTH